jgi:serine/threonine-protein kinase
MAAKRINVSIPGIRILGKIGKGQQGYVLKGVMEDTGQKVAIKILSPNLAQVAEYRRRFAREMGVATQLEHPNIVKAYKAGKLENSFYYVMEFARGADVNKLLEKLGPLPEKKAFYLGAQVADALEYAHGQGLIHRDIKPGNIMVDKDWRVKILDLGLAKDNTAGVALTMAGSIFGTANYISPEAIEDSSAVDARSDIYSLGATLYKMLTGEPPFDGMTPTIVMEKVLHETPASIRERKPEVSLAAEGVVMTALQKNKHDRYPSAGHFHRDLMKVYKGLEPTGVSSSQRMATLQSQKTQRIRGTAGMDEGILRRILAFLGIRKQ